VPAYNGNTPYIAIDGVNIGAYWCEANPSVKNSTMDVTAGTGAVHKQMAAGLNETAWKVTLAYIVGSVGALLGGLLAPGTLHTLEYGPEGNVSTKPRHVQQIVWSDGGFTQKVVKDKVMFAMSAVGAAAPTVDMFSGGVY